MKIKLQNDNELVMYFIVNKDLEMSKGKVAAQVAHSLVEYFNYVLYSLHNKLRHIDNGEEVDKYDNWLKQNEKKIILKAKQSVLEKLEKEYFSVRDLGLTEIPENSLGCICLGVMTRKEAEPMVKRLQLL